MLIKATQEILEEIFKLGFEYKKCGVLLKHIVSLGQNQLALFDLPKDNETLSLIMDKIIKLYCVAVMEKCSLRA